MVKVVICGFVMVRFWINCFIRMDLRLFVVVVMIVFMV